MKSPHTPLLDYIDSKFKGNKSQAAQFFEIDRTTLYSWIASGSYGVTEFICKEMGGNEVIVFKNIKVVKSVTPKEV